MSPRIRSCLGITAILIAGGAVSAGPATEQVKAATDAVIAIAADPALKGPDKVAPRRAKMREVIATRFDWQVLGEGTLGANWGKGTAEQQKEFIGLFRTLLERTYMKKIESYAGEKVKYVAEDTAGNTATVKTLIQTTQQTEIPLDYQLRLDGQTWLVTDVFIERVSLLDNYKAQFTEQLKSGAFADLITILKKKTAAKEK